MTNMEIAIDVFKQTVEDNGGAEKTLERWKKEGVTLDNMADQFWKYGVEKFKLSPKAMEIYKGMYEIYKTKKFKQVAAAILGLM